MDAAKPRTSIEQLAVYRQLITTMDGLRVCLRPLTRQDRDALLALFAALPAEETMYFRSNVTDPTVLAGWCENPEQARTFPLIAIVGDHLVGSCTLHLGIGTTRHIAEIRIFLTKDYRRRGIGTAMLRTQIDIARKLGLLQVIAEVVETQSSVIHAFEHLGFERQGVLRDMFMSEEGETLDMITLVKHLKQNGDAF